MQEQQKLIEAKKEEALNKALTETQDKVNVLDINVEDDFDIDDIWTRVDTLTLNALIVLYFPISCFILEINMQYDIIYVSNYFLILSR